jgi:hypothetical protein
MWKDKLKQKWNEDPITCIAVGSGAVYAAAALLNAVSAMKGRSAYAKQVDYRVNTPR